MADLTTTAAVKTAIGITGTGRDDVIAAAITAASDLIQREYEREFTVTASATRSFAVIDGWVDLAPYDLRTATTVTLDPDGAASVLTAGTDYQLHPFPARDGVSTAIELLITTLPSVTGRLVVSVAGAWGFASVPEPVERACIETVRAITRKDPGAWSSVGGDARPVEPAAQGTYAIPLAARRWLDPYRRFQTIG